VNLTPPVIFIDIPNPLLVMRTGAKITLGDEADDGLDIQAEIV
jgi:hypothetical protein